MDGDSIDSGKGASETAKYIGVLRPAMGSISASLGLTEPVLAAPPDPTLGLRAAAPERRLSSLSPQPGGRWRRQRRALRIGFTISIAVVILMMPVVLGFATLAPPYTAGCAGAASGTKIAVNVGTTGGGVYSYNNRNGVAAGAQWARSPANGSHLQAGTYYFVGPGLGGCTRPTTTVTGLNAWWNWTIQVTPVLMVNCSNNVSGAAANFSVFTLGNVHEAGLPYYLWNPHLKSVPLPFSHGITCNRFGKTVYAPGSLGPTNVSIRSPTFSLSAGTYDFYSSVWGDTATSYWGTASAYAAVNISATLSQVSCPGCP